MVIKDLNNIDEVLELIRQAVSEGNWDEVTTLLEKLRRSDQADVFSDLPPEQQQEILPLLAPESTADILEELEDEDVAEIANRLGTERLAEIVDNMEPDEAADLLGDIPPEQAEEVLSQINDPDEVRSLLAAPRRGPDRPDTGCCGSGCRPGQERRPFSSMDCSKLSNKIAFVFLMDNF